ncbi:hypothetical protein BVH03_22395 [Pseudomonas sp. PA15(2017)]|uniref:hypothetical protein n=1 Tax=Pseudomonas sp. PA15(2017) TaxID=1932111 RepID=UPI0009657A07|nr:hypothetical protein [Pseudomonas sp. PA15(2017)]OLU22996.1 hypothetical protein BVH03_22395 [Pseudomonas sp. PA15(2017)]
MSGTVVRREFPESKPWPPIDHPATYEEAEALAGHRLDRRKNFAIIRGIVHDLAEWTDTCSGCSCDCGCMGSHGNAGCSECGHTGKRRQAMWIPIDSMMETYLAQDDEPS